MSQEYKSFRDRVFSAFHSLAKDNPAFEDAQMLVGASESNVTLQKQDILKSIDTDWIDAIESALPYLDTVIRFPTVAIEDIEEVLPLEISRHVNDRSVKHLAQHTNLIQDIKGEDIIPQKILNVYRDETYLTYENKFVNTLLARLAAFVDRRYRVLIGGSGIERKYKFDYVTEFEHTAEKDGAKNTAKINLNIELTAPIGGLGDDMPQDINEKYESALERITRINQAITAYQSSVFAEKLGRAYIRPPVIRTNAILKNKDMKECLKLWEYIESFEKVGYSVKNSAESQMASADYVSDLYSTVALQYVQFYNGVTGNEDNRILARKQTFDVDPEFVADISEEDISDYMLYDSEYRKKVPVSRLMNTRKRRSEDEKKIALAINAALKAQAYLDERRREEEERRRREEEERKRLEELERLRREEEEARRIAEEEEARRLEAERRRQEQEARRLAEEERLRREEEARIEAERLRLIAEAEEKERLLREAELFKEEERLARVRASEIFMPDDGDLTGRYPLCPYTRRQYLDLGRKPKKRVKQDIGIMANYRDLYKEIAERMSNTEITPEELEEINSLTEQAHGIELRFVGSEKWKMILKLHSEIGNSDD